MSDWPIAGEGAPPIISVLSWEAAGPHNALEGARSNNWGLTFGSNWLTAGLAWYVGFWLGARAIAKKMFVVNGNPLGSTVDLGIYLPDGTRIVNTGATAQAGTAQMQIIDISDVTLEPGYYYMAAWCNNTTGSFNMVGQPNTPSQGMSGIFNQASVASNLPATATFAAMSGSRLPNFGIIFDSAGWL
jgi:hypothetical protein